MLHVFQVAARIDIWRSCRFIGSRLKSLCFLPGSLGRFVPCSTGATYCRLRHIGWEKCGHGLTSRPRESSSGLFLDELFGLFRYPPRSGRALLTGTLPLRYCAARFACKTPIWRLPVSGHVARLVAIHCEAAGGSGNEVSSSGVLCVSGSGMVRIRIRLNRKTTAHLVGFGIQCRPRVWKRLCPVESSFFIAPDLERRCSDQDHADLVPAQIRTGVG